jgi:hypothetical protein
MKFRIIPPGKEPAHCGLAPTLPAAYSDPDLDDDPDRYQYPRQELEVLHHLSLLG